VVKARYLLSSSRMFSPTSSSCCRTETSARSGGRRAHIREPQRRIAMAKGQQRGNREAKKIVLAKAVQATPEESMKFRSLVS
jgi:hypothetical protein